MNIEFFGGKMDGQKRDLKELFPGFTKFNDDLVAKLVCYIKGDGKYKATKVKNKWTMMYKGPYNEQQ